MPAKTTHVIPSGGQWIVKKSGGKNTSVFTTEKEAKNEALRIAKSAKSGQVVVHGPAGTFHAEGIHGMPKLQTPPRASKLGKSAIKKAIAKVIRARLAGE